MSDAREAWGYLWARLCSDKYEDCCLHPGTWASNSAIREDAEEKLNTIAAALGERDELRARVAELEEAAHLDIADARSECGGDGKGCEAFRNYFQGDVHRIHAQCGRCPMDHTFHIREALGE